YLLFHDAPPADLSTLSLHDALPISRALPPSSPRGDGPLSSAPDRNPRSWPGSPIGCGTSSLRRLRDGRAHSGQVHRARSAVGVRDRKSTRLNSSHVKISYAVFCLKK